MVLEWEILIFEISELETYNNYSFLDEKRCIRENKKLKKIMKRHSDRGVNWWKWTKINSGLLIKAQCANFYS